MHKCHPRKMSSCKRVLYKHGFRLETLQDLKESGATDAEKDRGSSHGSSAASSPGAGGAAGGVSSPGEGGGGGVSSPGAGGGGGVSTTPESNRSVTPTSGYSRRKQYTPQKVPVGPGTLAPVFKRP